MTIHLDRLPPFLVSTTLVALVAATGCTGQIGPEAEEETGTSQDALSCGGSCCGSRYNCRVPDRHKRAGCGGARIRNPATGGCEWPLHAGAERSMYDGLGNRIGEVRSAAVKLNQGIRKHYGGRWLVYAFNTTVRLVDGRLRRASGWIEQADLVHASRLHGYTLGLGNPGHGHYETRWVITGGDPVRYADRYLHAVNGRAYPANDYLVRPYGLVHLTYTVPGFALGGHATDSFLPGAVFRRAKGVRQIEIPLYGPRGYRSVYSLHFVYGYVHDGEERRYGWIAKEALVRAADLASPGEDAGGDSSSDGTSEPAPPGSDPAPPPSHTCSARCCDGTLVTGLVADTAGACVSASSPVCSAHEYVLRARFDGEVAYERERFCWAKCANREWYHRVDGVTSGCTDAARAFCSINDRGAFQDAMWDPCRPR